MEHCLLINQSTMMAVAVVTAAREATAGATTAVATTAVATMAMTMTSVATAVAVTPQRWPRCHTDGSRHRHSQQSTKNGSGRWVETAATARAAATVKETTTENGVDGGGIDAALTAGTDTDNNQLKAAAEVGRRRRWC